MLTSSENPGKTADSSTATRPAPTLTSAITNYNHARSLPRAIEAMITQSRPPDELILVDDCSTDDSARVIQDYAARVPFIRPIFRPCNGGYNAGITDALRAARGDYFYAGSADDFILPDFFRSMMQLAETHPGAGFLFGDVENQTSDGQMQMFYGCANRQVPQPFSPPAAARKFQDYVMPLTSPSPATIYRRAALLAVGPYRPELHFYSDTFQMLCVAARFGAVYVPAAGVRFFSAPQGFSHTTTKNFSRMLDIVDAAAKILRSEFADVLPAGDVQDWVRRSLSNLVEQQIDLTTPYQSMLRFEAAARDAAAFDLPLTLMRKVLSATVLSYQSGIRRRLVNLLMSGSPEARARIVQLAQNGADKTANSLPTAGAAHVSATQS